MAGPHVLYVKRVVGLPGERVAIAGGQVQINGTALAEALCPAPAALGRRGSDARPASSTSSSATIAACRLATTTSAGCRSTASSAGSCSDAAECRHRPDGRRARRRRLVSPRSCQRQRRTSGRDCTPCRRWSTAAPSMGLGPEARSAQLGAFFTEDVDVDLGSGGGADSRPRDAHRHGRAPAAAHGGVPAPFRGRDDRRWRLAARPPMST